MLLQNEGDAAATRSSAWSLGARDAWAGMDQASVMGAELMSAILTWSVLGWLADRWLNTGPWLLVVGALLGNAAGLYLVWLRSERMDRREREAREGVAGAH